MHVCMYVCMYVCMWGDSIYHDRIVIVLVRYSGKRADERVRVRVGTAVRLG